jgi:hypothetical protein
MPSSGARDDRSLKYRKRAQDLRAIGEGMADIKSKEILFSIAKDYERMASLAETAAVSETLPSAPNIKL